MSSPVENPVENERASLLDYLLREPAALVSGKSAGFGAALPYMLASIALAGAGAYGLIVGSFSGGAQWWAAPLKIVVGYFLSAAMCFPSFYIFACMSGVRGGTQEILRVLLISLALAGIVMTAVLPVSWVFTQASESVSFMGMLHIGVWWVAILVVVTSLANGMRALEASSLRLMRVWIIIFTLVTLQMMTTLRPIVGTADSFLPQTKKFFLIHWGDTIDASDRKK